MDGITAEMLKAGGEEVVQWMCDICNQVWNTGAVPADWKDGAVICIPKKGNLADCGNWNGVDLVVHSWGKSTAR